MTRRLAIALAATLWTTACASHERTDPTTDSLVTAALTAFFADSTLCCLFARDSINLSRHLSTHLLEQDSSIWVATRTGWPAHLAAAFWAANQRSAVLTRLPQPPGVHVIFSNARIPSRRSEEVTFASRPAFSSSGDTAIISIAQLSPRFHEVYLVMLLVRRASGWQLDSVLAGRMAMPRQTGALPNPRMELAGAAK